MSSLFQVYACIRKVYAVHIGPKVNLREVDIQECGTESRANFPVWFIKVMLIL